jgi:hypothetical protein
LGASRCAVGIRSSLDRMSNAKAPTNMHAAIDPMITNLHRSK